MSAHAVAGSRGYARGLRWTGFAVAVVAAALVAAPVVAAWPITAIALPGALACGVLWVRHPAVAGVGLFALTAFYGSLIAHAGAPVGGVVDLLLAGLSVAVLAACLLGGARRGRAILSPGIVAAGLYLAVTAAQTVTIGAAQPAIETFRVSAWFMLALPLVAYAGWTAATRWRIAEGIVVLAALVGAYATFRWIVGPAEVERRLAVETAGAYAQVGRQLRVLGSFPSGPELALWCALVIPLCAAMALVLAGRLRAVAVAGGALCVVGLLGSQHRTALVAVALALVAVLALYQLGRAFPGLHIGRTALAVGATAVVGVGAFALTGGGTEQGTHSYSAIFRPSDDPSIDARRYKWGVAVRDVAAHPAGYGLGVAGRARAGQRFHTSSAQFNIDSGYLKVALEQGFAVMLL